MKNRITEIFGIKYPIIQGGMVWCSGWKLASAVSENGGLGLIGAGSMKPEILEKHIQKTQKATTKPFGVNVPLLYPETDKIMDIIIRNKVKIVFTSAGNPKKWTKYLQDKGIIVAHLVSNTKFAVKCEEAGVDVIVAEGFEAGGHNGREETTSLTLIPTVREKIKSPLIAAGGIATGRGILATMALGAEGVQIGSLFAVSKESSAHENYKKAVLNAKEGDTVLTLKKITPVRFIKNKFYEQIKEEEENGCSIEKLKELLGKGRAKKGIFLGETEEGEVETGQISVLLKKELSVAEIMQNLINEYNLAVAEISKFAFKD